jgi:hypothetical protein
MANYVEVMAIVFHLIIINVEILDTIVHRGRYAQARGVRGRVHAAPRVGPG